MTEETLFATALEKPTPAERAAFLDAACAGDPALRRRLEALLASHEASEFLNRAAIPHARPEPAGGSATRAEAGADGGVALGFLAPAQGPGSLGRLGHYEVRDVVGMGGMGIVLRAFDEKLHRVVAIKVLAPHLATSATARRRFVREAQAAAAVRNDHVINIHAVEENHDPPYLVMEYIQGLSLQERIDRAGPLELKEVLRIGMQTAAGLAAAHAQGLVHRDIKPANILLENGVQRVKITDFGLARAANDASLTQSGTVAGTPQYMSPEQARGDAVDHRTDLFSLGSVLYTMCTGRPPFRASGTLGVLRRVAEEAHRPIRESRPDVPPWLVEVVDRLLAKSPADRVASAGEVSDLLGRYLAYVQEPSSAPPPAPPGAAVPAAPRPRRRAATALLAAASLGVISIMAAVLGPFAPGRPDDAPTEPERVPRPAVAPVVRRPPSVRSSPAAPEPRTPVAGATLPVGGPGCTWEFGWSQVPGADRYHLWVKSPYARGPLVDAASLDRPAYRLSCDGTFVSPSNRSGWRWKVRARVGGVWTPWSEERSFDTAPPDGQPPAPGAHFLVLGTDGQPKQKAASLAEAVARAGAGDVIEIRGDGPFLVEPMRVGKRLTIRAGPGFRPVLRLKGPAPEGTLGLLDARAPLVVEGLEFQAGGGDRPAAGQNIALHTLGAPVYVANCSFTNASLMAQHAPAAWVQNCQFHAGAILLHCYETPCRGRLDNNVVVAPNRPSAVQVLGSRRHRLVVTRNTLLAGCAFGLSFGGKAPAKDPIQVEVSQTVLAGRDTAVRVGATELDAAADLGRRVRQTVIWREERNVYPEGVDLLRLGRGRKPEPEPAHALRTPTEWDRFWGLKETGSVRGRIAFRCGEAGKIPTTARLDPRDVGLRPDSAGHRAGKDGRDVGPDVDLVGPGPAYERWKGTAEYRRWLEESGQAAK
jgi:hypothetical protein